MLARRLFDFRCRPITPEGLPEWNREDFLARMRLSLLEAFEDECSSREAVHDTVFHNHSECIVEAICQLIAPIR